MQKRVRARSAKSGTRLKSRRIRRSKAQAFNREKVTRARDIAIAKFLRPMTPKRRVNGRPDLTVPLFDPDSIMEYPVAAQLTTDHKVIGWNIDLSPTDKEFIAKFYPEPTPRQTLNYRMRPPPASAKQLGEARARSGFRAPDRKALLLRSVSPRPPSLPVARRLDELMAERLATR